MLVVLANSSGRELAKIQHPLLTGGGGSPRFLRSEEDTKVTHEITSILKRACYYLRCNFSIRTPTEKGSLLTRRWRQWVSKVLCKSIIGHSLFSGCSDLCNFVAVVDIDISPNPVQQVLFIHCMFCHFRGLHLDQGGGPFIVQNLDTFHSSKPKRSTLDNYTYWPTE